MRCRSCGEGLFKYYRIHPEQIAIVKFKDSSEEKDDYSPLSLLRCSNCGLVQLEKTVPPERLYSEFHYLSGINQSMNNALFDIVKDIEFWVSLRPGDIAVDIGANDGTLLSYYRKYVYTIGFEPAKNIKRPDFTDEWIYDYFSASKYCTRGSDVLKAKVVTAIAMFYDLEDPNKFLKDVREVLADDGIFVIQMNDLDSMCQNISIDNICHEHLCYYNMDTLLPLLRKNNLYPLNVSYNSVNGGSIRVICNKTPNDKQFYSYKNAPSNGEGYCTIEKMWAYFEKEKKKLLRYIDKHGPMWGYGASTRGNTLLQLLGLDNKNIIAIADRNPKKWMKFTAGGNIPILSEDYMRDNMPKNLLVLPYYFESEFLAREIEYLKKGGRMIFPLPRFRIYTSDKKGNLKVHGLSNNRI